MKKQIARWLIVSLGMSSTVWAQEPTKPTPGPCGVTSEQWRTMPVEEQIAACDASAAKFSASVYAEVAAEIAAEAAAQPVPTTKPTSRGLGIAGLVTMGVGLVMVTPRGEEVDVLGTPYCVTNDYQRVEAGSCNNPASIIKAGLAVIGIGALLSYIGFKSRTVKINPSVSPSSVGADVSVKWGK